MPGNMAVCIGQRGRWWLSLSRRRRCQIIRDMRRWGRTDRAPLPSPARGGWSGTLSVASPWWLGMPWSPTRKRTKDPGQRYQLLLQPVLMPRISTGCKNSWYLWPAVIKGKGFGTGLNHHPVPKPQYRHRLVPPTDTKRTRRNRYRLVAPTGA